MEPSWGSARASWPILGQSGDHLGPFRAMLGPSWDHLGTVLGHLGPSWAVLGPFWDGLGVLQACKQKEELLWLLEASVSYKTMVPDKVFVAIVASLTD